MYCLNFPMMQHFQGRLFNASQSDVNLHEDRPLGTRLTGGTGGRPVCGPRPDGPGGGPGGGHHGGR